MCQTNSHLEIILGCVLSCQIEEQLGVAVPFTVVFEYPTLRLLAAHILRLLNTPAAGPIGVGSEEESGGASLAALADAAAAEESEGLLLSQAAKAAGVACAPAQMYFVSLQQVRGASVAATTQRADPSCMQATIWVWDFGGLEPYWVCMR
jgi:hypothetical protein